MTERWHEVAGRPVRSLVQGRGPDLVVVPGLGALGYLAPALERCAAWATVHLLDLPGFGHPRTADCPSALDDVARTTAAWLREVPAGPVLLVGHSTGAQAALRAAVQAPDRVQGVVLSGATFPPSARTWPGLIVAVARTVVHERPSEARAVAAEYRRGGRGVLALLRSALRDRPEDLAAPVPPVVVRGRHDRLCPPAWAAGLGRVVELPGAHNTTWTHPEETAAAWRAALLA